MPGLFNDRVNDDATNIISSSENADRAEAAAKRSETAADNSIYAASQSQTSAQHAEQSNQAATTAASNAAISASAADNSAKQSIQYANNANDYMVAAEAAAVRAENADHDMQVQIDQAHAYADQAGVSATQAAISAADAINNASYSATNANLSQQWAISPTIVANTDQSSKTYAGQSKASATASATSASQAQTSESNAKTYSIQASQSATNSGTYASQASASATNAKTSETNASQSKDAAALSAQNAKTSETNSLTSANLSKDWSAKMDGTVDGSDYSSHYWAKVAQDAAVQKDVLLKAQNLADVPDKAIARTNLSLDRVSQGTDKTVTYSADGSRLVINDGGKIEGQDKNGNVIPLAITSGGTGARDIDTARINFGLGKAQTPQFGGLFISTTNSGQGGGVIQSARADTNGTLLSQSRLYNELINGVSKTTINTFNSTGNKNSYIQFDENGALTGVSTINTTGTVTAGGFVTPGYVSAAQGQRVGLTTQSGGNKDIYLTNTTGDGSTNGWVNLLQGNWYNGYWQLGGIRGSGTDIATVRLGVNNQGSDWKYFDFNNSYGGHLAALRGFKGQQQAGSWAMDNDYMGAPFYSPTIAPNNSGYSPIVAGGTRSSGGYEIRSSFGLISGGTTAWPRAAIHMLGDATYHRAFEFNVDGSFSCWDSPTGIWGGTFVFQRQGSSDRNIKDNINYDDGVKSYNNIMSFNPCTFTYINDKNKTERRGVIAQDIELIDDEYVTVIKVPKLSQEDLDKGMIQAPDQLALDNNVILMDTALATRYIGNKVIEQQKTIDDLVSKLNAALERISVLENK